MLAQGREQRTKQTYDWLQYIAVMFHAIFILWYSFCLHMSGTILCILPSNGVYLHHQYPYSIGRGKWYKKYSCQYGLVFMSSCRVLSVFIIFPWILKEALTLWSETWKSMCTYQNWEAVIDSLTNDLSHFVSLTCIHPIIRRANANLNWLSYDGCRDQSPHQCLKGTSNRNIHSQPSNGVYIW